MMTTVYKIPLQCWIGSTDVNGLLGDIGGWHVGCENAMRAREAVEEAIKSGWVQTRMHYAPAFPEGVLAYEVTDAGLQRLEDSCGPKVRQRAEQTRRWYRDRTSRPAAV